MYRRELRLPHNKHLNLMKEKTIILRCATCGSEDLELNETQSYAQCMCCGREYLGGYDEVVELNQEHITQQMESFTTEVEKELKQELISSLNSIPSKNKFFKIKWS